MKKTKKIVVWVVVIAAAAVGAYYAYGRFFSSEEKTQSFSLSPENIITVEGGDVIRTVDAFGEVRPNRESFLAFASSGILEKIEVEEGEKVEEGKVLARLKNAQQKSQLLQAENAYKKAKVDASSSELKERELAYEAALESYEKTLIKAPFSGEVAEIRVYEGDSVSGSTQIIYLVNRDKIYVDIDIDEVDIKEISIGQKAEITFDAYPELKLPALIDSVSPLAISKGGITVIEVTLELTQSDPRIMSGFSAEVEITVEEVHNVVRVPTEAVVEQKGKHFVFLVEENAQRIVSVNVGKGNDEYIEVLSGLKENDRIAANAYQLFEQFKQQALSGAQKGGMFPGMPGGGGTMRQLVPGQQRK
jgi:multidrug efflux pump subunit AcrA (membrane-fusion protein)